MKNFMQKSLKALLKLLILFFIAATLYVAKKYMDKKDSKEIQPRNFIRPVKVMCLQKSSKFEVRIFPGQAQASKTVKMAFRVSGPLESFPVNIGDFVKKGETIAKIDPRDFVIQIKRIQAALKEAESKLKAMRIGARPEDIKILQANLKAAQARLILSRLELHRNRKLYQDKTTSKATYDQNEASYKVNLANLNALNEQLKKAKKGSREEEIQAMVASIEGLKTQLKAAINSRMDTNLKAPFNGYVDQKFVENFETVSAGTPIVSLIDCSTIEAKMRVPEEIVTQESHFLGMECEFDIHPGKRYKAILKEIGKNTTNSTASYPLTATLKIMPLWVLESFKNHPIWLISILEKSMGVSLSGKPKILPGMTCNLSIQLERDVEKHFEIPVEAVLSKDEHSYVWICDMKKQTVKRRKVKLGNLRNDKIEILEGLKAGEYIVIAGTLYLKENQKIRPLIELDQRGRR